MLLGTPSGPTSDCQARAQRGTDFGPAGFRGDFSGAFVCPEAARFVTAALVSARESAATFEVPVTARPAVQQDERTRRMRKSLTVLGLVLSVMTAMGSAGIRGRRKPCGRPEHRRERSLYQRQRSDRLSPLLQYRPDQGRSLCDESERKPRPPGHPSPKRLEGQRSGVVSRWKEDHLRALQGRRQHEQNHGRLPRHRRHAHRRALHGRTMCICHRSLLLTLWPFHRIRSDGRAARLGSSAGVETLLGNLHRPARREQRSPGQQYPAAPQGSVCSGDF